MTRVGSCGAAVSVTMTPCVGLDERRCHDLARGFDECQDRCMSNLDVVDITASTVPCCPPVTAGGLTTTDAEVMAGMFKALGDPVRLRLFANVASSDDGEA